MKIIEALKNIKDLKRKASDIREKIKQNCALLDCETPTYPDQRKQVAEWLQSHTDIVKEICDLKTAIQRTNLSTEVTIELGGIFVKKSISAWIERRKELAGLDELAYSMLTDRGLREQSQYQIVPNAPIQVTKRVLFFDAAERDKKKELYRSEPSKINSTLEIVNAVTDLI